MKDSVNRLDAVEYCTSGLEPMTFEELTTPVDEHRDPVPGPVEIVPGIFVTGTHFFEPGGLATPELPEVDVATFDVVVTLTEDAGTLGEDTDEICNEIENGIPDRFEIYDLGSLIHSLYPQWLEGESILIRSHYGLNRAPLVAALFLAKAGVDPSVAVQLIRSVHSEFAFNDEPALSWLLRESDVVLDFDPEDDGLDDWERERFAGLAPDLARAVAESFTPKGYERMIRDYRRFLEKSKDFYAGAEIAPGVDDDEDE